MDLKRLAAGYEERSADAAARLTERARRDRLLDVAIGRIDSPIGTLTLAVTPRGLARLSFDGEDPSSVMEELARDISPRILESAAATQDARRELDEYFAGRRTSFSIAVDRQLIRGIAKEVLSATSTIPFGSTSTYGTIAERIGRPRAARAVGNALGSNPIPVVIPCHRVLAAGGKLGGYTGGVETKRALLELEGSLLG